MAIDLFRDEISSNQLLPVVKEGFGRLLRKVQRQFSVSHLSVVTGTTDTLQDNPGHRGKIRGQ